MANRPYLYFTDDISALTFEQFYLRADGSERMYMDSRHQFPLAWKMFFRPEDVFLAPNPNYDWEDLYLVREWEPARAEFFRRLPLLLSWFPGVLLRSDIDTFFERLETLIANPSEKFLVLNPRELEIGDDHVAELRTVLAAWDDSALTDDGKFERLDRWSGSRKSWNSLDPLHPILGFYYGGYGDE